MNARREAEYKRSQDEFRKRNVQKMNNMIAKIKRDLRLKRMAEEAEAYAKIPKSDSKTTINQLSHDCLVKIFSYFPAVSRLRIKKVCKKWEEAVEMSWSNVKQLNSVEIFKILSKNKEENFKTLLENCCKYLTHLTIHQHFYWLPDVLSNNCNNIVHLSINLTAENESHLLFQVISSMSKLKYLKAEVNKRGCRVFCSQLFGQLKPDIEEIHLEAIDFHHTKSLPPTSPVLNRFTNLCCLTLKSFRLTIPVINSILQKKNSIVYLDLTGSHLPETEYPMIFSKLVNLEHLNLGKIRNFYRNDIVEIARNCGNLKFFEFSDIYSNKLSREIFCELKYLKNLEHLDIPAVCEAEDNQGLVSDVVGNCKKLRHLNVGKGDGFTEIDLVEIKKLEDLKFVSLAETEIQTLKFKLPSDVQRERDALDRELKMLYDACRACGERKK